MSESSLRDLDRCPHGRHLADPCFDCPDGRSTGNPYLFDGRRIGTTLYGEEIRLDRVCRLAPTAGNGVVATVQADGSVWLCIARDVPPEWANTSFDGRETGEVQVWGGMLAHACFPDGDTLLTWLDQTRDWWIEEKRKRPWL